MHSLIDTPLTSEQNKNVPRVLLFPGNEVLPPNLIKEDMEMIDPEDLQPLSVKVNKNQNPDTMVQPLNPPATRKQKLSKSLEYVVPVSGLFLGTAMLFYYSMALDKNDQNVDFWFLFGIAIVLIFWELTVYASISRCSCSRMAAEARDKVQAIFLMMLTIYLFLIIYASVKQENFSKDDLLPLLCTLVFFMWSGIMTIIQIVYMVYVYLLMPDTNINKLPINCKPIVVL